MKVKTVTVQLTLDDSSLYFRDLGEMFSRHISELCSKGNFAHEFAAGIYRALADQLENAEFDGASSERLEQLTRNGFDETMYGSKEPKVTLDVNTVDFGSDDNYGVYTWRFLMEYNDSAVAKKLHVILEKYTSNFESIDDSPIRVLTKCIIPIIDDFKNAQSLLQEMAAARGLRIEKSKTEWKKSASIDEILKEEDKIVFYGDILTVYYWSRFVTKCPKYSIFEATEGEVSDFVAAYAKLPDGFQTADTEINDSFSLWIQEVRGELHQRLTVGMFIDDIKAFAQEYGLPYIGIPIKNHVESLERAGVVSKGKRKGKVFYSLSRDE